jgi:tetratricopeptide (TPR) repeat protein
MKLPVVRREYWVGVVCLIVAAAAAYSNSFHGPFIFDDILSIPENGSIRRLWPLSIPLHPPGFGTTVDSRPVLNLSLALNYAVSGTDVWSYHCVNLLIHVLGALTLFGLLRRSGWRVAASAEARSSVTAFALAVSLLWEVHPLQTESVTYVVQRAESLMSLCYLLTLYGFIRSVESVGPAARAWQVISWGFCLLGMGTKEVMVSAPVMVLIYDGLWVSASVGRALVRRPFYYLSLAACWIPLGLLVHHAGSRGGKSGPGSGVPFVQYWLTQPSAIAHYLRLTFWPDALVLDYGVSWVASIRTILPALSILALLLAATGYGLLRARRSDRPTAATAVGYLGLWFFALLAPTSLVPGSRQTLAEHRMYLALIPVLAAAVWGLAAAIRPWVGSRRRALLTVGLVLAVPCVFLTYRRNRDYLSDEAIFAHDVQVRPDDAYAQLNFGDVWVRRNRPLEGIKYFQAAIKLGLDDGLLEYNYGVALANLGRVEEAAPHFEAAIRLTPPEEGPQEYIFLAMINLGRVPEAIRLMAELLRLYPVVLSSRAVLAEDMVRSREFRFALPLYEAMVRAYPDLPDLHMDLGNALVEDGRPTEAIPRYREALRLRPDHPAAHYDLAQALLAIGRPGEATAEFRLALQSRPDFTLARYHLGLTLLRQGDAAGAAAEFERILRAAPSDNRTRCSLGDALWELGRTEQAIAQFRTVLMSDPDSGYARAQLQRLGAVP